MTTAENKFVITTQGQVDGPLECKLHGLGQNLFLEVKSPTSRNWLFIYKVDGKQKRMGLGSACGKGGPKITLTAARGAALNLAKTRDKGKDPVQARLLKTTFADYCRDTIIPAKAPEWRNSKTGDAWTLSLLGDLTKPLHEMAICDITPDHIGTILDPIRHSMRETARKTRQRIEHAMRLAKKAGMREGDNPATREALGWSRSKRDKKVRHHPAMPYEMAPKFFASLDGLLDGHDGLKLLMLTSARTSEVAFALWSEFHDLDGEFPVWIMPENRVKNGKEHIVPLTKEALAFLATLPRVEGEDRLFPAYTQFTMYEALKRLDGCDGFTVHGFRSTFRTWCGNTTNFPRNIVEETYGHDSSENPVEAAYNNRPALQKRLEVLTAWNEYVARLSVMPVGMADELERARAKRRLMDAWAAADDAMRAEFLARIAEPVRKAA